MKTFIAVLKNDYRRAVPLLGPLVLITVVMIASIWLAVYITGVSQVKGHVVFVSQSASDTLPQSPKLLDITVMSEKPPHSALVEQKYDAFIEKGSDGSYQIDTLKSDEFKNMLLLLLQNPNADINASGASRGVGVNIIGFMMMFLLMMAYFNMTFFADDKEQGQMVRIASTPASFPAYLAAHCFYCLSLLLPEFLTLTLLKLCGKDIGFTLGQYALLILILAFLGISFSLFLHTLIMKPDNANMLGNSVTVLTTVLAGSFYSFSRSNKVFDNIIKVLPQKDFMDFAEQLEKGNASTHILPIAYVVLFSLAIFSVSCFMLRKMYVKKV